MPLSVGDKLGPYEILAPIGAGGMGEVYRARDTQLDRDVAIKVLPDALARDPERLARFKHEAKALASLNHPNIGHIYGVESQALVMELVHGETLASLLQPGPLPMETALDYARQIAEALEAAHDKGIVHRDLKPSNVMVTPEGVVKVLDFGLAKTVETTTAASDLSNSPTMTQSPTRAGVILGTAAYMSPEQARGASVDKRSDVWTFGVVFYEMLAGTHAFAGQSVTDILAGILRGEPDWSALPAATPTKIRELLRRCLERDRRQRLQAIAEARIAIDTAATVSDPVQDVQPVPARARLWPWAVAALGMALAITAAFGWWRASRSEPLRPLMRLSLEFGSDIEAGKSNGGGLLALSPDGTLLAVTVQGADGKSHLATRRLDQNQTTTLAGTEDAESPFFSPDGQWIAFNSDRKIKKISAGGGVAVTLCDIGGGITGSWGDDGNIIAPLGWGSGLSRIPSAGGAPTPVTELDREKGEFRHGWPQVLPGSGAVLFTTGHTGQAFDDADIEVASLKTRKRTLLHHGGFFARYLPSGGLASGHLVWVHRNVLYAAPFDLDRLALAGEPQPVVEDIDNAQDEGGDFGFSQTGIFVHVSRKGALQRSIFWLDNAGVTRPLFPAPGRYGYPHFSPDGNRLAFSSSDDQNHEDIWVRDLERDTASRVTRLLGQNEWPIWTPDGKNLIFWSSNPGAAGLYWIRADGSGLVQRLTDGKIKWQQLSLSRDGQRLGMARVNNSGGVEIWTAVVDGDASHPRLGTPEPFLQTPFVTMLPSFSPDSRWIAYTSREPGKEGLWVVPFPGPGGGWLISSRGSDAIWSGGPLGAGHELFFLDDNRTIMATSYIANGDAFEFSKPQVWSPHPVLDLGSPPVSAYDLAPDGKRFAVVLNSDGTAEPKPITHLTVLVNFFDELRRKVPARQ